jgi:MoaA/NifB/PqqE/SkfB family radical SAM enzyme
MSTRVIWQFIVMRNNEHELERARDMARELGVEFFAKPFATSVPDLVPVAPQHRRRMVLKPCTDIYSAIFVYWNGDVVVCCYDQDGENVIGNVGSDSLLRIWDSPRARRLRRRIDAAMRAPEGEPPMCRRCLKWSHHPWQTSDGLVRWEPVDGAGEVEET